MQRVVIDTNVLASALRSRRGASFKLISLLGDPRWQPIVSVALVFEYEEVGKREAGRLGLAEWVVESIIDTFCRLGAQPCDPISAAPATQRSKRRFSGGACGGEPSRLSRDSQSP